MTPRDESKQPKKSARLKAARVPSKNGDGTEHYELAPRKPMGTIDLPGAEGRVKRVTVYPLTVGSRREVAKRSQEVADGVKGAQRLLYDAFVAAAEQCTRAGGATPDDIAQLTEAEIGQILEIAGTIGAVPPSGDAA